MSDDNKKSVIEIIRNDNSDYFLSEVEKLRKELFDLSKSINEEIGNLKNTDSMRYNKINYDVFKKVDVLDLRTANINETMNKKAITDEKNRRNVLSKIQELYKGTISQINEKYNSLKDVLDLLEIDNSEKINDITKSIKENLTLVDENLKKKEYELLEIFSSDLTKLNEQLSIYIDEKNRISEDNLLELEEVFTEHFENISGNIDRISENFKIELKNVNETFESVKKDINGLNNTQETNYKYILEYFSKLEENSVLLEKDLKSAINDKLDSKKFIEYIDESTKKYSLLGSDLKTLRENFTNISKNIIDKIALTTEASLNSTQIQELIIQLLEEKFNNKVETITIIKEENEEKINTIKDELKVINESIENDLSNTISNFETKFKKQISDIERQLRNFEKNGVKKEDIEQIVKDNPEMFKGEKGEIPDHKYSNGWLFFQKPDGEWGTPIKVKSNDEERRMPTFASSGGMGGGAIGGSLDKYYLTKMFDVDSTGSNTDKSILTYSASENKFVFVHSINDSGTSTSDLWTADKIIDYVDDVAGDYIPSSEKGQANGVATLDKNGIVPTEQLPSYVDDIIEVANYASLPITGETGKIYITLDTNSCYRWSGTIYVKIADEDKVPYTGADKNVDLGANDLITNGLTINSSLDNIGKFGDDNEGVTPIWLLGEDKDDAGIDCFKLDFNTGFSDDSYILKIDKDTYKTNFGYDLYSYGNITSEQNIQGQNVYVDVRHNYEGVAGFPPEWRRIAYGTGTSLHNFGLFALSGWGDDVYGDPEDYVRQNNILLFTVSSSRNEPNGMQITILHSASLSDRPEVEEARYNIIKKLRVLQPNIGLSQSYLEYLSGDSDENNFRLYLLHNTGWTLEDAPFPRTSNGYYKALGLVIDIVNTKPSLPEANTRYIVGTAPTGDWTGRQNQIALWNGSVWSYTPAIKWMVYWVEEKEKYYQYLTSWGEKDYIDKEVISISNTPPISPVANDMYIIGTVPTGDWVGHENEIATFSGTWTFVIPENSETYMNLEDGLYYVYIGTSPTGDWRHYNEFQIRTDIAQGIRGANFTYFIDRDGNLNLDNLKGIKWEDNLFSHNGTVFTFNDTIKPVGVEVDENQGITWAGSIEKNQLIHDDEDGFTLTDDLNIVGNITASKITSTAQDNTDLGGDNLQENGLILDGAIDTDKQILFRDNGVDKWAIQGAWRNEDARFMYFYNLDSEENILAMSRNGRFGLNRPTSLVNEYVAYNGTGLNDVVASGNFEGNLTTAFRIYIDSVGATDTFRWEYSVNAGGVGSTWTSGGTLIPCQVTPYHLRQGVYIQFGSTTGHVLDLVTPTNTDRWSVRGFSQDPPSTFDLKPPMIHRVMVTEDAGSTFTDYTYKSATTQCSIADSFEILGDTNHYLYLGNASKWSSTSVILSQYGSGGTFKVQYLNGSDAWVDATGVIDETTNLTANGDLKWDNSVFVDWAKKTIDSSENYWLRLVPVTAYSTKPELSSISRHSFDRLSVYSAHNDLRPAFKVEGDGITKIWKAERVSTASSYRNAEYITEQRLKEALSVYQDRIAYLTNTVSGTDKLLSLTIQSSFSNTYSVANNTPTELETWIEFEDAINYRTSIEIGDIFDTYLYLQKTTANRGVTFQVDLLVLDAVGTTLHTYSSAELVAPLTTNIEAYSFLITANTQHSFVVGEKLAIRIKAKRSGSPLTTQNILVWGGGTYNSQLNYPSLKVTLDRLFLHFEEDQDTLKNQWKAKGTGTDYDIELVPKGAGIVRTTSDLDLENHDLYLGSTIDFNSNIHIIGGQTGQLNDPEINIGYNNTIAGNSNIAIGSDVISGYSSGEDNSSVNIAIGNLSEAGGRLLIGALPGTFNYQNYCVSLGHTAKSVTENSIAIGRNSIAGFGEYDDKISKYVIYDNTIAIGYGAQALNENSVAIGTNCINAEANTFKIGGDIDNLFVDGTINSTGLRVDGVATAVSFDGEYLLTHNTDSTITAQFTYWYTVNSPSIDFYNSGTGNYWDILFDTDYVDNDDSLRMQINGEDALVLNTDKTAEFKNDVTITTGGLTLDSTELLTIGTGTLTHDGTEFTANDDINLGANDIQATEFRMGTNAVMKFNAITNSIDFIIN